MGGVAKPVAKMVGLTKTVTSQPVQAEAQSKVENVASKASRMDEEQGAKMRGARRRGRQLLSDARLNPEAGVQTLGSGQAL